MELLCCACRRAGSLCTRIGGTAMQQASISLGAKHTLYTCINISVRTVPAAVRQDKACRTWLQNQMEILAPPQPKHVVRVSCCLIQQFTISVLYCAQRTFVVIQDSMFLSARVCCAACQHFSFGCNDYSLTKVCPCRFKQYLRAGD